MPMLEEILGLYSVHHPKSTYRCTHCHVKRDQLADFLIEDWPMRELDEFKTLGATAASRLTEAGQKTFAAKNFGIQVRNDFIIITYDIIEFISISNRFESLPALLLAYGYGTCPIIMEPTSAHRERCARDSS